MDGGHYQLLWDDIAFIWKRADSNSNAIIKRVARFISHCLQLCFLIIVWRLRGFDEFLILKDACVQCCLIVLQIMGKNNEGAVQFYFFFVALKC